MPVFRFHLANLFLGISEPPQFGLLGFGIKERHPGFGLVRRHRGLENTLCMISDIGRIIGENTRLSPVDTLQKRLYRLWYLNQVVYVFLVFGSSRDF